MPGSTDTEIARLLSAAGMAVRGDVPAAVAGRKRTPIDTMPDERSVLRTHLLAVIESLRRERDRLVETRQAAETATARRVEQLEQQWGEECAARQRQLAQAALEQARQTIDSERAAQARELQAARAELERERQELATERRELAALQQEVQPAAAALREQRERFDRDRRAWDEYRLQQQTQLEQQRQALSIEMPAQQPEPPPALSISRRALVPGSHAAAKREPHPMARDERQEVAQMASSAFDNWYSEKLARLRRSISSGAAGAELTNAAAGGPRV